MWPTTSRNMASTEAWTCGGPAAPFPACCDWACCCGFSCDGCLLLSLDETGAALRATSKSAAARAAQTSDPPPSPSATARICSRCGLETREAVKGGCNASARRRPLAIVHAKISCIFAGVLRSSSFACSTACSIHFGWACDQSATASIFDQQSSWLPCCSATLSASSMMASSAPCPRSACATRTWRLKRSNPSSSICSSMASLSLTGLASTRQPKAEAASDSSDSNSHGCSQSSCTCSGRRR
mmetsp:Transcript_51856/g.157525  ORF Transcript_51856/g.157525 Transcript_51856/m.157525 type:complete len:242 (-) Transcript_51856:210-935(-)